jgi:S-phase kinase-associated protein 1
MADEDFVTLVSADGETFRMLVGTIKGRIVTVEHVLEDVGTNGQIPLPNVAGKVLARVCEFANWDIQNPTESDETKKWCEDFMMFSDASRDGENFELLLAANYLGYNRLLDVTCAAVANQIRGKTPEEIRARFHIPDDLTPEEKAEIQKENEWAKGDDEKEEQTVSN